MYMAYWSHGFYGITDGFVIHFPLATVRPDADGMFQVELPYFSVDTNALPSQRRAGFQFTLYDAKTSNQMKPDIPELQLAERSLRILSKYPDGMKFTVDR